MKPLVPLLTVSSETELMETPDLVEPNRAFPICIVPTILKLSEVFQPQPISYKPRSRRIRAFTKSGVAGKSSNLSNNSDDTPRSFATATTNAT